MAIQPVSDEEAQPDCVMTLLILTLLGNTDSRTDELSLLLVSTKIRARDTYVCIYSINHPSGSI